MVIKSLDREKCIDCGVCYDICPMDVFKTMGEKVYIAYPEDCMTCHLCEDYCPTDALYVGPERATEAVLPF